MKEKFKRKKYKILIGIVLLITVIIGINKLGSIDVDSGKVRIKTASIKEENKLAASIIETKGYDLIKYPVLYTLEKVEGIEDRTVVIKGTLNKDESKYAHFKEINEKNITSTIKDNGREIEIKIEKVKLGEENKIDLNLVITGAPNEYKINPKIEVKEISEEKYTKLNTKEIQIKTNSITGIVTDEAGMSVSNIEISLHKDNNEIKRTYTDKDGRYVFSDIEEGLYTLKIEEEVYQIDDSSEVEIKEGTEKNISVKQVEPYKINVRKYINRVKIVNKGKTKEYSYDKLQKVVQSVKNLQEIEGEIEYKVVVKNEGTKEGIITRVEEELDKSLTFNKEKNKGWKEKNGKLYNTNLEGLTLKKGETKEITLVADITKTNEAKVYLSKVIVKGEVYEKVSYILDGKEYKVEEVLEGEKLIDPKLEIENFSGWYTDKNYTNKYDFNKEVTKDIILYGKTKNEVSKYNVTYIDNGEVVKTEELEEGTLITPPIVTKEGYTFDGWYEKEEKYDILLPITKDLILESKYNINTYKITFKNDNGDILQEETLNYGEIPVYKEEGPYKNKTDEYTYTFKSWDKEIEKVTKDEEYTAIYDEVKNKYKVTYIIEGEEYYSETLEYGSIVLEKESPEKSGYTFLGWYNEDDVIEEYPITLTKDITLYGKYQINTYTIRFFDKDVEIKDFEQKVEYQNQVKEPELAPTLEDYKFIGWVIKGTDTPYVFGTPVEGNIDLESKFTKKPTYLVTFNIEGNTDIIMGEEVIEGKLATRPDPDPIKKGYTFDGWYTDNTYSNKYDFNDKVMNNIEIYGRYIEDSHIVTYHNEDEIYNVEKVLDSYTANKPSEDPTKEGYTFKYWSKEENGVQYNFSEEIKTDIDLYAVYEINSYEIVFRNYDGVVLQSETLNYGDTPEYKGEIPVREKTDEYTYVFSSWDKEITNVTKDEEYTAVYTNTKNKYKITFVNYNGEELQSEILEYGSTPVYKGETPVKEKTDEYTYTFKSWDKEIVNVTKNETYVAVFDSVKIKYTVIYMDGDSEYTRKEVEYGDVVAEEVITKQYNIYRGWKKDNQIFDFNTPITDNITLYSFFELVEAPIITHEPTSWTKGNVIVTITSDHNDYSYVYKIDAGDYQEYTRPFEVSENSTIVAKSIKEDIESVLTTHDITNIDKIDPKLINLSEDNISVNSFDIKVKAKDNESGISQIRVYKDDELITRYTYNTNLNDEKEENYNFTGLTEKTKYNIKIEVEDKVGNITSESKEITTKERIIVARIIGRDNKLYENEEEYELFESLSAAVNSCASNECTIQMVLDANESIDILDGQDITLDINGKIIDGVRNYTIQNRGNLILIDNAEDKGTISNRNEIAIKNVGTGVLQIGENEEPLSVSVEKPNIIGSSYGIYTEDKSATLKFYDGKIEGNVAIQGDVNDTPYLYNAGITSTDHQIATLSILAEAEAKIVGGKYHTNLTEALDLSKKGTITKTEETQKIMSSFITPGMYGFAYDKNENTLINNNTNITNTTANSYIKLDLTNYEYDQELVINAQMQGTNNYDFGYATITDSKDIPAYNGTDGRFMYITGNVDASDYKVILEKGKSYYLHIGYRNGNYNPDLLQINNITLNDYIVVDKNINYETDLISSGDYTFVYDNDTKTLKNNNSTDSDMNTTASSYLIYDLTEVSQDKKILINAEIQSNPTHGIGYVTVTNSSVVPSYNDATNRYIYISGTQSAKNYEITLKSGQINYVHIGFYHGSYRGAATFTINSISDLNRGNVNIDYTGEKEVINLNQEIDTVQLLKNITLTSPLQIDETKEVVLDLKGNTLTTSSNDYVIKNYGNLKIIDSKFDDDTNAAQKRFEEQQAKYDEEYETAFKLKEDKEKEYQKKLEEYNMVAHDFVYTGDYQEFVAPVSGEYKIELWGASGEKGNGTSTTSTGAYTSGTISLEAGEKLYVYVGDSKTGYNGGGISSGYNNMRATGGGATDIRLSISEDGSWDNFDSLKSRIMVASGGGGHEHGAPGGAINGIDGDHNPAVNISNIGLGATQISGGTSSSNGGLPGTFGKGGDAQSHTDGHYGGGGGGGYYGGSGARWHAGGGSGSSFISGYDGCDAIDESSTEDNIIHTGRSIHYSELSFINPIIKAGNEAMPTFDGTSTMTGNPGNGYAKITLISDDEGNTYIPSGKPLKPVNGYTTNDYINDGLQLHLDGITSSSDAWNDLSINGKSADIIGPTYQDNSYLFDGSDDYMEISNSIQINGNATLQVTVSVNEKRNQVIYSDKNSNILLGTYNDKFVVTTQFYSNTYTIPSDFFNGEIKNVTVVYSEDRLNNKLYVDNKEIEKVNDTDSFTTSYNNITIGKTSNGWPFKGNIYSIRVYNRALTETEIEKNSNIDTYRFKGIVRKEATLDSVVQTGNITSTNGSVIYNHNTGNLDIARAIINLNKSGVYNAISNYGSVKLQANGIINIEQYDNIGIRNYYGGTILKGEGTINANSTSRQYGIYNSDYITKEIGGYTIFTNSGNSNGFYHDGLKGINISDFVFKGTGTGFTTISGITSESNINNSSFNGTNIVVLSNTNINNTNLNNGSVTQNSGITNLNEVQITNDGYVWGVINASNELMDINNITINNKYYGISNYGKGIMNVNGGKIITGEQAILNNTGTININNNPTITSSKQYALRNNYSGTININSGVITSENREAVLSNYQYAGTINIGSKDKSVSIDSPVIIGNTYGVYNSENKTVVNFYDGIIKGKTNAIYGVITDHEEDYDLNLTRENEVESAILKEPTDYVVQIGDTKYTSIQSAVDNAQNNDVIDIISDIDTLLQITIPLEKNIVLNLNGHKIKSYSNNDFIINNGTLKIIDSAGSGTILSNGIEILENNGTLTIESGTIKSEISLSSNSLIKNNNLMNVMGGEITSTLDYNNKSTVLNEESGILNITGGSIEVVNYGYAINNKGELTATGGVVKFNGRYVQGIINQSTGIATLKENVKFGESYLQNYGELTINELTLNNTIMNYSNGEIIVNGGTLNRKIITNDSTSTSSITLNNVTVNSYIENRDYGVLNINGGKITITNRQSILNYSGIVNINDGVVITTTGSYAVANNGIGTTNINSGVITSTNRDAIVAANGTINIGVKGEPVSTESPNIMGSTTGILNQNNNAVVNFYDGIITGQTAIQGKVNEIEEGYDIVDADTPLVEGSQTKILAKLPVAKILSTNQEYDTIQDAVNAVTIDGETIQIIRDLTTMPNTESIEIPESKNIILDINGYKLQISNDKFIINNGTLKIIDSAGSGTILSNGVEVLENNGTLTVESGIIKSEVSLTTDALIKNNSIMNVTGGEIILYINNRNSSTIISDESGTLNITGGTIEAISMGFAINNKGNLIATGGTVKSTSKGYSSPCAITTTSTGTTLLKNNIDIQGDQALSNYGITTIENILVDGSITNNESGKINITGGTIGKTSNTTIYNSNTTTTDAKIIFDGTTVNNYFVNEGYGMMEINNSTITSNIENRSGVVSITDSSVERSGSGYAILNSGGTTNINSGTVKSKISQAVAVTGGTVNIGVKGNPVSTENPVIIGKTYGIENSGNRGVINFYDGIITGEIAIQGKVNEIEPEYEIIQKVEEENETKYLAKLPVAKLLSTNEEFLSIQEAVNAITKSKETLQIMRNATILPTAESIIIPDDKNIVMDLNGYKLEVSNSNFIINNGTLTIKDSLDSGTILSNGVEVIENNGTLTIESGKIKSETELSSGVLIKNNNIMNIIGGEITDKSSSTIINEEGATLNITGGTVEVNRYYSVTVIQNKGMLTATGGIIKGYSSYGSTAITTHTTGITKLSENINIQSSTAVYNIGTTEIKNITLDGSVTNSSTGQIIVDRATINDRVNNDNGASAEAKIILEGTTINNGISNYGSGTIEIKGGEITSNNSVIESNYSAITNIKNNARIISNSSNNVAIIVSSQSTLNIESAEIISNSTNAIRVDHTAIVNIGVKGSPVGIDNPVITGKTYGIYNNGSDAKINFYDGIVSGEVNAFYGTINEVEPGYKITTNNDGVESATLTLVGDNEKVAVLNGINFEKLQDAVNSASNTEESVITLYTNVTLTSDITVPAGKNIKLVLNGNSLVKGSYDFIGEGNITIIGEEESTSIMANIIQTVKDVLNINNETKNIIVYEMENGDKLTSDKTYKLYKIEDTLNEINLEEQEIGKYKVSKENDNMRTVKNRLYINDLVKGKYKIISNTGEQINFEITDENTLIGKVRENTSKDMSVVVTAIAELIITIQTGISVGNYVLLMFLIMIIITLLYLVRRQKEKEVD